MSDELKYLAARAVTGRLDRRAFLGRAAALGVSATMAQGFLAGAARAAGPQRGGVLKAGLQGGESTNSLDPATFASTVPLTVGRCWGETLVEVSPSGEIEHRLAESIEASADAATWRFKIRKDVEFHNGKTLTAEDVLATMERHSGEDTKSGALGVVRDFQSMRVDGDVFEVTLGTGNADLPYLMADYHLMIQPNGGMDAPAAGMGTGPYTVEVDEPGVRHVLGRFDNYWDAANRGHADTVEVLVINDATARTGALQGGQVHMMNRVEPKIVDLVKRVPGVTIQNVAGRGHYVFIMHCNTAPFDNPDMRLALKYAMDRQDMVDKILRGYGSIGNDTPINGAYPLFSEDMPQREFDPDKARFHFEKSGHTGPVTLRTSDVAFPGAVDAAQLYQQSCAAAGIEIEVKREPGDGYWSDVWNAQPFCTSYWGGRPTQDQMFATAYLSTADWNDTRFFRDDFDKMLFAARAELDQAKRKAIYRDMSVMLHDDGGLILPMFNDFIDATGDVVDGWEHNPNAELMDNFALVKTWLKA